MPAGGNYRSLSSFTCLPPKAFTIHLLLSRPYSRVATEPTRQVACRTGILRRETAYPCRLRVRQRKLVQAHDLTAHGFAVLTP
jgi:hypothetical protein